jgi:hypothetical protein
MCGPHSTGAEKCPKSPSSASASPGITTVVRRVGRRRAFFFDSWGFPRTTGFDYFTFDKEKAGEGDNEQTLLVYHQTFLIAAPSR